MGLFFDRNLLSGILFRFVFCFSLTARGGGIVWINVAGTAAKSFLRDEIADSATKEKNAEDQEGG